MVNKVNGLAHTKWICKYQIMFTPKYKWKVIYNQYKESIRDILKQLCAYNINNRRASYVGSYLYACEYST